MAKLTGRQAQILLLLIRGDSQKTAARKLGISPGAVRAQMTKARGRVGAASTAEMVHRAHAEIK